jgi:hypothetical protein
MKKNDLFKNMLVMMMIGLMSMGFVACGGNNEEAPEGSFYLLIGKWTLRSANGESYNDSRHYIVFDLDGTYEVFPKGNPFGIADRGNFVYEDSEIIFNNKNNSPFLVERLTKTMLVVSQEGMSFTFTRDASEVLDIDYGVIENLIGKWELRKSKFYREEEESYDDGRHYMILNKDFTYKIQPRNLFEAEKTSGTWSLTNNSNNIIFDNSKSDNYRILTLTSKTLKLGWLSEGIVMEETTFEKVE